MRAKEFEIYNYKKLDRILENLCKLVIEGQNKDADKYGMVAAAVLDTNNNLVEGLNLPAPEGKRRHAERVAIDKYMSRYGDILDGSIVITTCSPCSEHMDERYGESCTDLLNQYGIKKVYAGYMDPTQEEDNREFNIIETRDSAIRNQCKEFADSFLDEGLMGFLAKPIVKQAAKKPTTASPEEMRKYFEKERAKELEKLGTFGSNVDAQGKNVQQVITRSNENFADGKHPERKGLAKRSGVNCKASVSTLRNVAKHSSGEKQRMAHWCANMKSGRSK